MECAQKGPKNHVGVPAQNTYDSWYVQKDILLLTSAWSMFMISVFLAISNIITIIV